MHISLYCQSAVSIRIQNWIHYCFFNTYVFIDALLKVQEIFSYLHKSCITHLKPTIHEATFVVGDTATLLFVRAAHGNIAWYILQVA